MKKRSGFTLIEVLAVIIIIGVLAIIAVPAVTKYISRSNDSVYASDAFAYAENVRSKYEMGEYGDYLKDNEIMIVPIRTVVLEKGNEEESTYGALGTIYRLNGKEYKKIETREIIGEDVYDAVLDRGSDPGGKSDWVNWINLGGYTRETAGHGFVDSTEGKNNFVRWGHSS